MLSKMITKFWWKIYVYCRWFSNV